MRILLRGQPWVVREQIALGERVLFRLQCPDSGETVEALSPPDEFEPLADPAPALDRRSHIPYTVWRLQHEALRYQAPSDSRYAAFRAGRLSPEPYQFAPLARLLAGPRRSLLIADDVGLGKTVEAGICLLELIARGVGKRILLVVPPGLIPQWQDEMREKFGLVFQAIENAASLDRAQTLLSEGLQPWAYFDRIITSIEYLKRREVHATALAHPWDVIVVDEAHYLAESGTPANPYSTARTRLGPRLRESSRALILLTATPHNGYRHSFRSLLELVEPTQATLHGETGMVRKRVGRAMIRRLKPQIVKTAADGNPQPAFPVRLPVQRIEVKNLCDTEREIFSLVTDYCARTIQAAEGSEEADLVSFAMQIVKKRMLSSRTALRNTIANRLDALASRVSEEPPARAEVRELQADLPLAEAAAERTATRILRAAIARDARRRDAEKKKLKTVARLLEQVAGRPDPKIAAFIADLDRDVVPIPGEKVIVFTEYRDTLAALREALAGHPQLGQAFVELTGGLTSSQRKARIARFHQPACRLLLATDAASEGLNLQQMCCRLYHFELPWNPNRLEQRNGRIDRHGQTRPPAIRYLFYPDSPEDRVLDRLVQRIAQMHDDRVSTPDILGILEGARVEDILGRIESASTGEAAAETLMRTFEVREQEFAYQIAPFLMAGADGHSTLPFANAVSADPMIEDDREFERTMRDVLSSGLRDTKPPGCYSVEVPRHLRGPGVESRYACVTFRRSVAVQYSAAEVEFIHRLHPLARTLAEHALLELTVEPARNSLGSRVAVRRHALAAKQPIAVFSFLGLDAASSGLVYGIAVDARGNVLDDAVAETLLWDDIQSPGEVPWAHGESVFGGTFASLQAAAAHAAHERLRGRAARLRIERAGIATVLREEAALYRVDRFAEIKDEETAERIGVRDQIELFREASTNWDARRAAVETHYSRRLEDVARFAEVPVPSAPQPLGVLLVMAPE